MGDKLVLYIISGPPPALGPSIYYVRIFTCYLDPLPPTPHFCM